MTNNSFKEAILQGIPNELPQPKLWDTSINHAPIRKQILTPSERKLALKNALRYFPEKFHVVLAEEFAKELKEYGRIYMYRFRPDYKITARNLHSFPHKSVQAASIMLMLSNNLDYA
ncbi:MAG TPA: urocanate hydratase, partial [Bacteroidales bacterium]|nr:urocanate hydratase [Bacteroidales bacterium]